MVPPPTDVGGSLRARSVLEPWSVQAYLPGERSRHGVVTQAGARSPTLGGAERLDEQTMRLQLPVPSRFDVSVDAQKRRPELLDREVRNLPRGRAQKVDYGPYVEEPLRVRRLSTDPYDEPGVLDLFRKVLQ
jgi:hypothetical protein